MIDKARYIGPDTRLQGKTAQIRIDEMWIKNHPESITYVLVQFDDSSLREGYGRNPYPASYFEEVVQEVIEMCSHMLALIEHCSAVGVKFGGCGDCGSAWLTCNHCHLTVENAHKAFDLD